MPNGTERQAPFAPVPANTRRVISIPSTAIFLAAISITGASAVTATTGVGI